MKEKILVISCCSQILNIFEKLANMKILEGSQNKFDFKFHSHQIHVTEHVDSNDMRSLVATWPELASGDCLMEAGLKMTIYENGCYNLHGRVRSTDDDDIWHIRIDLLTASGNLLCSIPPYAETIDIRTGKAYNWQEFNGSYDNPCTGISKIAQVFDSIKGAIMHYSC